ncbi:putative polyamine transporter 4 [Mollisia scopiformis]|uniref:Putative polyamine transporter 4 n=1 Tax=Mollisia scopiformis TaxID=149040 RepID=A0A132BAZ5_MOLSC|nr:putative polyamine transporter 4 [Mollisia scopiformis]KUJ09585.1 putative polyamine transporter 4 [Mollisia scopiformis]
MDSRTLSGKAVEDPANAESDLEAQRILAPLDLTDKDKIPHKADPSSDLEEGTEKTLDWESPDDPDNPRNWPKGKKLFHTYLPALYGFTITIGTSVYVPAIPHIMEQFHVEREVAILPLSLYTVGFVVGPLLAAPLSEIFGRRIIYWTTIPMLLLFTGIAGASDSIALLIVMRLLAGTGGSGTLAIGAGTIADLWDQKSSGKAALGFIMAPFLGPALGPLTGAYIISEYHNDWRYSMWVVLIIGAPIFSISLFMQETSKVRILHLRQKKLGCKAPHHARGMLQKVRQGFIRPWHMMFVEPLVGFLSIYTGFSFAMMFSFFGSYSYVFELVYHFNQKEVGLTFLGILVGFILAIITFGIFDATLYAKASIAANGKPAPEHRLYAAMLGSVMLAIGLFWFAWSPHKDVHWIVPVLAGVPFGWGALDIFISVTAYLVDVYQASNSASAVAANGILRYGLGAVFPLFTLQLYEAIGIHWAGSVFAFVALAMLPVPWIFFWKGKFLRARSHYDTSKD